MSNIAFVGYGFSKENIRKQPWNYVWRFCMGLINRGHQCILITDGGAGAVKKNDIDGLPTFTIDRIRPRTYDQVARILDIERIDIVFWSFTPKSFLFYPHFRHMGRKIILFMALPIYSLAELVRAQRLLRRYNLSLYYLNWLVPKFIVKKIVNSDHVDGIVAMSTRNKRRLLDIGCKKEKVWFLPHGFDADSGIDPNRLPWQNDKDSSSKGSNEKSALYMGGPEPIRGPYWLIRSFALACKNKDNLRLTVLWRTDDAAAIENIQGEIERIGISDQVDLVCGILSPGEVNDHLLRCDFVVLPFVLVPSEVPISILEAMQAGKPVIATDVDGIPELVGDKGIAVKPGDTAALSNAIIELSNNDRKREAMGKKCRLFMEHYPNWDQISDQACSYLDRI